METIKLIAYLPDKRHFIKPESVSAHVANKLVYVGTLTRLINWAAGLWFWIYSKLSVQVPAI